MTHDVKLVEKGVSVVLTAKLAVLRDMDAFFKFRPEGYWRSASYTIYKQTQGKRGWDGYYHVIKIPTDTKFAKDSAVVVARSLRGFIYDILGWCKTEGYTVDKTGMLPRPFKGLKAKDVPDDILKSDFKLDLFQRKAVAAWLRKTIGKNKITVSGGKTACFCAAAAMIKQRQPKARFLYLTQTERLNKQVYTEARKFLPHFKISKYGGGDSDSSGEDMVVATSAMLRVHFDTLKKKGWFLTFYAVLMDEDHHLASPTWSKILLNTPSYFRIGASDTGCFSDKAKHSTIKGLSGPIWTEVEASPLIDSGRIARPLIYIVDFPEWTNRFRQYNHTPDPESQAWALVGKKWEKGVYLGPAYQKSSSGDLIYENDDPVLVPNHHEIQFGSKSVNVRSTWCLLERSYDKAIVTFKERNNVIGKWTKFWAKDNGLRTLVVCTRTVHVLILHSLLSKINGEDKVKVLYKDHSPRERDECFEWFKSSPGNVLISPLVKEGVSINEIEAGFVADHVVNWEVANQIIGRFIRKKSSKNNIAHLGWFLDRQHPKMRSNSMALFEQLENIRGYRFYYPCTTPELIGSAKMYEK